MAEAPHLMDARKAEALLEERRRSRRGLLAERGAAKICAGFSRRIAVVLSGGGARGAYEAGVLLAFQDAGLPTHIITAASIGSINAASFAAHSKTLVGDARTLVRSWLQLTPAAVGIEWTRYALMLAGLLAMLAGLGNLLRDWMGTLGFVFIHLHDPRLTWLFLALAGASVLFLHDHIPYMTRVVGGALRGERPRLRKRKLAWSLLANAVVGSFAWVVLSPAHLHLSLIVLFRAHPWSATASALGLAFLFLVRVRLRDWASLLSHRLLRLPLRSGLFSNRERASFLREHIPMEGLRASPIRVVMTATDVRRGSERFFSNASKAALLGDPGADEAFVTAEIEPAEDLMEALIASSALPIIYEAVRMKEDVYMDGSVVMNQPLRPAVHLGAEVIFLVIPSSRSEGDGALETFIDLGLRSIEILIAKNLKGDLKQIDDINRLCERFAVAAGVRPEQMVIDLGYRSYRHLKLFTLRPAQPLGLTKMDFDRQAAGSAILQGYEDGIAAVLEFLVYAAQPPVPAFRRAATLSCAPEGGSS
jgi:predicted acylesterase/phospholipase RssA